MSGQGKGSRMQRHERRPVPPGRTCLTSTTRCRPEHARHVDRRVPRLRDVPDARRGDAAVDAARRPFPTSRFWAIVAFNTTHVPWQGCSLHDLIQPAFSFLVGAALPFSIASRRARGRDASARMLGARRLAQRRADPARHLPALAASARRPTGRSRTRSRRSASATRSCSCWRSRRCACRSRCSSRSSSASGRRSSLYPLPGPDFDYTQRRRAGGLAAPLHGLPRALQQELEPVVGVRRLVPEPVPARVAVPLQRAAAGRR